MGLKAKVFRVHLFRYGKAVMHFRELHMLGCQPGDPAGLLALPAAPVVSLLVPFLGRDALLS
jgi:hypothetical protein